MATVSKSEISRKLAEAMGWNISNSAQAVDALFAAIKASAEAGDTVNIAGFGRFEVRTYAARTARNPQTGAPVAVPETRKLVFKPTKSKAE